MIGSRRDLLCAAPDVACVAGAQHNDVRATGNSGLVGSEKLCHRRTSGESGGTVQRPERSEEERGVAASNLHGERKDTDKIVTIYINLTQYFIL